MDVVVVVWAMAVYDGDGEVFGASGGWGEGVVFVGAACLDVECALTSGACCDGSADGWAA